MYRTMKALDSDSGQPAQLFTGPGMLMSAEVAEKLFASKNVNWQVENGYLEIL